MPAVRVRFHLGAGRNYMKWQIRQGNHVNYYDPDSVTLQMLGCHLRNNPKIARKIYDGENKTVCAWIDCDNVIVHNRLDLDAYIYNFSSIGYNPRKYPNWVDSLNNNIDNSKFAEVISDGRKLLAHN